MSQKKKLVDLVHQYENINESQLKAEYLARIASWEKWIEQRQNDTAISMKMYMQENAEYSAIDGWISMFLKKRLEWITESVTDPELRLKYLQVLPPFSQKGNIKQFLVHFFQLADHAQQSKIVYNPLNKQEKELRVLWDMYKLTRTIKTVRTLKKWLAGRNRSSSHITGYKALAALDNLQKSLIMVFRMCIEKVYQNAYLNEFPKHVFFPQSILDRIETRTHIVNPKILDSMEYRNYLFFIYYRSKVRGELNGQTGEFEINYLDYEIIRQEFLAHWISQRLKNNPRKQEVYEQYKFGNKTFAQITASRPEMEINLLKRLPKDVFDDLMAQVDDGVDPDLRAPVDTMSESFGSFARDMLSFETAKMLAKKSVEAIRSFIARTEPRKKPVEIAEQNRQKPEKIEPAVSKKPSKELRIRLVESEKVSFPFFCENNSHFARLHKLFRMNLGPARYADLNAKIEIFLSQAPDHLRIVRRTPRHEWAVPFIINNVGDTLLSGQLLILGAELKSQQKALSYATDGQPAVVFQSYFVYGAVKKYVDLGVINESRRVNGERFFIYESSHPGIISRALKLIDTIIERQDQLFTQAAASP